MRLPQAIYHRNHHNHGSNTSKNCHWTEGNVLAQSLRESRPACADSQCHAESVFRARKTAHLPKFMVTDRVMSEFIDYLGVVGTYRSLHRVFGQRESESRVESVSKPSPPLSLPEWSNQAFLCSTPLQPAPTTESSYPRTVQSVHFQSGNCTHGGDVIEAWQLRSRRRSRLAYPWFTRGIYHIQCHNACMTSKAAIGIIPIPISTSKSVWRTRRQN